MEGRTASLRVGLLLLAGIALLLALLWFLRGGNINSGTLFVSYFSESVQGLEAGSRVQYRGVTVGRVTDIGVVSAIHGTERQDVHDPMYRQVYARYLVDTSRIGHFPSIPDAVAQGLRARLNSQFITGLAYIELDFVDPKQYPAPPLPWQPTAEYVPSIPSAFAQVQNAGQQLLAQLDKVDVAQLVTSVSDLATNLNNELASGDLHDTLVAAQDLLTSANTAVKGADLPGLSADLKSSVNQLNALMANPQLKELLSNGALATDRLAQLTGRMSTLIGSLESTVRQVTAGTSQLQAGLGPMVRNMQAASENLRELTSSLRQYPGQVLSGPPPPVRGPLR